MRRGIVAGAAAVMLALVAGCEQIGEMVFDRVADEVAERGFDGEIDIDTESGEMSFGSGDDEFSFSLGEETELPDDFPAGLDFPASLTPHAVVTQTEDGQRATVVQSTSTADYDTVLGEVRAALEPHDFEEVGSADMNGMTSEGFGAEVDGREVVVYVSELGSEADGDDVEVHAQVIYADPSED